MIEIYYKLKVETLEPAKGEWKSHDKGLVKWIGASAMWHHQGCSHDHMFVQLPTMTDQQHKSSMLATWKSSLT